MDNIFEESPNTLKNRTIKYKYNYILNIKITCLKLNNSKILDFILFIKKNIYLCILKK